MTGIARLRCFLHGHVWRPTMDYRVRRCRSCGKFAPMKKEPKR